MAPTLQELMPASTTAAPGVDEDAAPDSGASYSFLECLLYAFGRAHLDVSLLAEPYVECVLAPACCPI